MEQKLTPALGDCSACFDAVCSNARGGDGKLADGYAWQLDVSRLPAVCHWAQEVGDVRLNGARDVIYQAACGRTFSRPVSILDARP